MVCTIQTPKYVHSDWTRDTATQNLLESVMLKQHEEQSSKTWFVLSIEDMTRGMDLHLFALKNSFLNYMLTLLGRKENKYALLTWEGGDQCNACTGPGTQMNPIGLYSSSIAKKKTVLSLLWGKQTNKQTNIMTESKLTKIFKKLSTLWHKHVLPFFGVFKQGNLGLDFNDNYWEEIKILPMLLQEPCCTHNS